MTNNSMPKVNWMDTLVAKTNDLKDHYYWPSFWDVNDSVMADMKAIFGNFKSAKSDPDIDVYVNNGKRYDYPLQVQQAPYDGSISIDEHIRKTIGEEDYCLTVNGLTKWDPHFTVHMQEQIIKPIVESKKGVSNGMSFYMFMGNYGYTSFGAHKDPDHSLIFQLGPADKEVWIWPNEQWKELNNGSLRNSFDFDRLLPEAQYYRMAPGDFLFIPKDCFHLFKTPDLSLMLGGIILNASDGSLLMDGMELYLKEKGQKSQQYFDAKNLGDEVQNLFTKTMGEDQEYTNEVIMENLIRHKLMLMSNGYLINLPEEKDELETIDRNKTYVVPNGFELQYMDFGEVIQLYIRGKSIELPNSKSLATCLEMLNSNEPFNYEQFKSTLQPEWPDDTVAFLFKKIHQFSGCYELEEVASRV